LSDDSFQTDESVRHVKSLDGVRGIAILSVVLFHSLLFISGWIGVQIFFVLSGFLITLILVNDSDLPLGFYLKRFYWRRTLRVFPLYFGYVAVLALVYFASGHPEAFRRDWPYLLTYTLNFRRIWPDFGMNMFYGRFWSLAIEEQFYLIWPLLVYLVPRKHLLKLVTTIIFISPLLRLVASHLLAHVFPNATDVAMAIYFITPCQLDSFAVGAAVALFGRRLSSHGWVILACCTVLLVVCGQLTALAYTRRLALNTGLGYEIYLDWGSQYIWGYTLINLWAGAAVLVACSRNWLSTMLSYPWLTYIGKISYGMYVYHQIILYGVYKVTGKTHSLATLASFLVYFCILLVVSDLSFRFYESKFLALKDKRYTRLQFAASEANR
jgi:peptidoglycan/LPS O-acetylase OafA/YrhL